MIFAFNATLSFSFFCDDFLANFLLNSLVGFQSAVLSKKGEGAGGLKGLSDEANICAASLLTLHRVYDIVIIFIFDFQLFMVVLLNILPSFSLCNSVR